MCVKAYLHHDPVWSVPPPTCNMLSVTGAAEAAVLDLLVLQLHDFLERDALQGSVSWNGVTNIFIWLPRVLKRQKKVESEMLPTEIAKMKTFYLIFTTRTKKLSFLLLKSALQSS